MAATGFTPILVYASGTTGNTPLAANLTSSASGAELALNYFDGKLFYKDASGVVQVLATKGAGTIGGSNTQVQYNSSGALAGSANLTFNGTTLTANTLNLTNALGTAYGGTGLTSFTANGVVYASSTSALTTGSVLTFDGTVLTASAGASTTGNFKATNSTAQVFNVTASNDANTLVGLGVFGSAAGAVGMLGAGQPFLGTSAAELSIYNNNASGVIKFGVGSSVSEQMRLTSTGLGIGTSSPAFRADVINNTTYQLRVATTTGNYSDGGIFLGASGTSDPNYWGAIQYVQSDQTTRIVNKSFSAIGGIDFYVATTLTPARAMKLDSFGNLGLGVTPSAWGSGIKSLDVNGSSFASSTATLDIANNAYYNGAGWIYKNTATAAKYTQSGGIHYWYNAPSGTAGNAITFTQAMTLDASGNLLLGTTSSDAPLSFKGTTSKKISLYSGSDYSIGVESSEFRIATSGFTSFYTGGYTGTERARITSGGDLLVGTTSVTTGVSGTETTLTLQGNSAGKAASFVSVNAAGTGSGYLGVGTDNNTYVIAKTNHNLIFGTNNAERARITSGGSFCVHDGTLVDSGLVSFAKTTETSVVLAIKNPQYSCDMWATNTSGDNVWARFFSETLATQRGSISYNRTGGLVAYNTTSDYRAKDILGSVTDSGAIIDALKVYEGKMKGATQSRPMLVAHEAQEVAPYAVTGEKDAVDDDGNPKYQQMDVSSFVPLLIAEIQSLRQRVAQLEQGA